MIYQEEDSSTFTHNGEPFILNKVLKLARNIDVKEVFISELEWILEYNNPCTSCNDNKYHQARMERTSLEAPILITSWNKKLVVLDGIHRLEKAKNLNLNKIKSKFISEEILEKSKKE